MAAAANSHQVALAAEGVKRAAVMEAVRVAVMVVARAVVETAAAMEAAGMEAAREVREALWAVALQAAGLPEVVSAQLGRRGGWWRGASEKKRWRQLTESALCTS